MLLDLRDVEGLRETTAEQVGILLSGLDIDGLYLIAEGFANGRLPSGPVEDARVRLAMSLAVPTLLAELSKRLAAIEEN